MQKSPHFLTRSGAIAGFISQSLGLSLPSYAWAVHCNKIGSQNAPKLSIFSSISKKYGAPPPFGRGQPTPLALAMIRPPVFKPWILACKDGFVCCRFVMFNSFYLR